MEKKLLRSRNSMIAGVCGGIANYFGLDPTLVRVGYVILSVISAGFPGILVYILLMLIMPMEQYSKEFEEFGIWNLKAEEFGKN